MGFCILLVPVNRWLAVKIGQLSTSMMAQKDQRVKVQPRAVDKYREIYICTSLVPRLSLSHIYLNIGGNVYLCTTGRDWNIHVFDEE